MSSLAAAALLAGCAVKWSQPGKSDAELQSDVYQCQREATSQDFYLRRDMIHRCLRLKGWTSSR